MFKSKLPRGYRNNNPGNIKQGAAWDGLKTYQTDSVFASFISPEYGYRAMAKTLLTYQNVHGIDDIRGIISRYAPSTENATENYIDFVAAFIGYHPDDYINIQDNLLPLMKAMVTMEQGYLMHTDKIFQMGIDLA